MYYSSVSSSLPESAPKFNKKYSVLYVSYKKNMTYKMVEDFKSAYPSLHLTFSRTCYILLKTANKLESQFSKISKDSGKILDWTKLSTPFLNSQYISKILGQGPEASKTLAIIWFRNKNKPNESW